MEFKTRFSLRLKLIALFLSIFLCVENASSYAQSQHRAESIAQREEAFLIPAELGQVDEIFQAPCPLLSAPCPKIYYIQDAHDSLEAQENIAKIIQHLVKTKNVKTVFEEGYEGKVPTDEYFGFIKDEKLKEKVAYFFLDKLRIGGAEYAHIMRHSAKSMAHSEKLALTPAPLPWGEGEGKGEGISHSALSAMRSADFQLIGIDSLSLHRKNIKTYRLAAKHQKEITQDLDALDKEFRELAKRKLSSEFRDWLKLRESYEQHKVGLVDYIKRSLGLGVRDWGLVKPTPHLLLLISNRPEARDVLTNIKPEQIFSEIKQLEKTVIDSYLTEENTKKIYEILELIKCLRKINQFEMSREEYDLLKDSLHDLETKNLARFLVRETKRPMFFSRGWEDRIKRAAEFYEIARERERALEQKLKSTKHRVPSTQQKNSKFNPLGTQNSGLSTSILVFGGFHKDAIKDILKRNGFSYVVITPKISKPSPRHQEYYKQLMSVGRLSFEFSLNLRRASRNETLFMMPSGREEVYSAFQIGRDNPFLPVALWKRTQKAVGNKQKAVSSERSATSQQPPRSEVRGRKGKNGDLIRLEQDGQSFPDPKFSFEKYNMPAEWRAHFVRPNPQNWASAWAAWILDILQYKELIPELPRDPITNGGEFSQRHLNLFRKWVDSIDNPEHLRLELEHFGVMFNEEIPKKGEKREKLIPLAIELFNLKEHLLALKSQKKEWFEAIRLYSESIDLLKIPAAEVSRVLLNWNQLFSIGTKLENTIPEIRFFKEGKEYFGLFILSLFPPKRLFFNPDGPSVQLTKQGVWTSLKSDGTFLFTGLKGKNHQLLIRKVREASRRSEMRSNLKRFILSLGGEETQADEILHKVFSQEKKYEFPPTSEQNRKWIEVWKEEANKAKTLTERVRALYFAKIFLVATEPEYKEIQHQMGEIYIEARKERYKHLNRAPPVIEKINIPFPNHPPIPAYLILPPNSAPGTKIPPTLLFHGISGSKEFPKFDTLEEKLIAQNIAVIRTDHFGHGENLDAIESPADFVQYAEAITEYIQKDPRLNAQSLNATGFSLGGWVALQAAIRSKKVRARLKNLAIINAPVRPFYFDERQFSKLTAHFQAMFRDKRLEHLSDLMRTMALDESELQELIGFPNLQIFSGEKDILVKPDTELLKTIFGSTEVQMLKQESHYLKPDTREQVFDQIVYQLTRSEMRKMEQWTTQQWRRAIVGTSLAGIVSTLLSIEIKQTFFEAIFRFAGLALPCLAFFLFYMAKRIDRTQARELSSLRSNFRKFGASASSTILNSPLNLSLARAVQKLDLRFEHDQAIVSILQKIFKGVVAEGLESLSQWNFPDSIAITMQMTRIAKSRDAAETLTELKSLFEIRDGKLKNPAAVSLWWTFESRRPFEIEVDPGSEVFVLKSKRSDMRASEPGSELRTKQDPKNWREKLDSYWNPWNYSDEIQSKNYAQTQLWRRILKWGLNILIIPVLYLSLDSIDIKNPKQPTFAEYLASISVFVGLLYSICNYIRIRLAPKPFLIQDGLYRYSQNPVLILFGPALISNLWSASLSSIVISLCLIPAGLFLSNLGKRNEFWKKFGDEYRRYVERTSLILGLPKKNQEAQVTARLAASEQTPKQRRGIGKRDRESRSELRSETEVKSPFTDKKIDDPEFVSEQRRLSKNGVAVFDIYYTLLRPAESVKTRVRNVVTKWELKAGVKEMLAELKRNNIRIVLWTDGTVKGVESNFFAPYPELRPMIDLVLVAKNYLYVEKLAPAFQAAGLSKMQAKKLDQSKSFPHGSKLVSLLFGPNAVMADDNADRMRNVAENSEPFGKFKVIDGDPEEIDISSWSPTMIRALVKTQISPRSRELKSRSEMRELQTGDSDKAQGSNTAEAQEKDPDDLSAMEPIRTIARVSSFLFALPAFPLGFFLFYSEHDFPGLGLTFVGLAISVINFWVVEADNGKEIPLWRQLPAILIPFWMIGNYLFISHKAQSFILDAFYDVQLAFSQMLPAYIAAGLFFIYIFKDIKLEAKELTQKKNSIYSPRSEMRGEKGSLVERIDRILEQSRNGAAAVFGEKERDDLALLVRYRNASDGMSDQQREIAAEILGELEAKVPGQKSEKTREIDAATERYTAPVTKLNAWIAALKAQTLSIEELKNNFEKEMPAWLKTTFPDRTHINLVAQLIKTVAESERSDLAKHLLELCARNLPVDVTSTNRTSNYGSFILGFYFYSPETALDFLETILTKKGTFQELGPTIRGMILSTCLQWIKNQKQERSEFEIIYQAIRKDAPQAFNSERRSGTNDRIIEVFLKAMRAAQDNSLEVIQNELAKNEQSVAQKRFEQVKIIREWWEQGIYPQAEWAQKHHKAIYNKALSEFGSWRNFLKAAGVQDAHILPEKRIILLASKEKTGEAFLGLVQKKPGDIALAAMIAKNLQIFASTLHYYKSNWVMAVKTMANRRINLPPLRDVNEAWIAKHARAQPRSEMRERKNQYDLFVPELEERIRWLEKKITGKDERKESFQEELDRLPHLLETFKTRWLAGEANEHHLIGARAKSFRKWEKERQSIEKEILLHGSDPFREKLFKEYTEKAAKALQTLEATLQISRSETRKDGLHRLALALGITAFRKRFHHRFASFHINSRESLPEQLKNLKKFTIEHGTPFTLFLGLNSIMFLGFAQQAYLKKFEFQPPELSLVIPPVMTFNLVAIFFSFYMTMMHAYNYRRAERALKHLNQKNLIRSEMRELQTGDSDKAQGSNTTEAQEEDPEGLSAMEPIRTIAKILSFLFMVSAFPLGFFLCFSKRDLPGLGLTLVGLAISIINFWVVEDDNGKEIPLWRQLPAILIPFWMIGNYLFISHKAQSFIPDAFFDTQLAFFQMLPAYSAVGLFLISIFKDVKLGGGKLLQKKDFDHSSSRSEMRQENLAQLDQQIISLHALLAAGNPGEKAAARERILLLRLDRARILSRGKEEKFNSLIFRFFPNLHHSLVIGKKETIKGQFVPSLRILKIDEDNPIEIEESFDPAAIPEWIFDAQISLPEGEYLYQVQMDFPLAERKQSYPVAEESRELLDFAHTEIVDHQGEHYYKARIDHGFFPRALGQLTEALTPEKREETFWQLNPYKMKDQETSEILADQIQNFSARLQAWGYPKKPMDDPELSQDAQLTRELFSRFARDGFMNPQIDSTGDMLYLPLVFLGKYAQALQNGKITANPAEIEHVQRMAVDAYRFVQLSLLSMRAWDFGDPNENLDQLQKLLDLLEKGEKGSEQTFAGSIEHAVGFAKSIFTGIKTEYLYPKFYIEKIRPLAQRWKERFIVDGVVGLAQHLHKIAGEEEAIIYLKAASLGMQISPKIINALNFAAFRLTNEQVEQNSTDLLANVLFLEDLFLAVGKPNWFLIATALGSSPNVMIDFNRMRQLASLPNYAAHVPSLQNAISTVKRQSDLNRENLRRYLQNDFLGDISEEFNITDIFATQTLVTILLNAIKHPESRTFGLDALTRHGKDPERIKWLQELNKTHRSVEGIRRITNAPIGESDPENTLLFNPDLALAGRDALLTQISRSEMRQNERAVGSEQLAANGSPVSGSAGKRGDQNPLTRKLVTRAPKSRSEMRFKGEAKLSLATMKELRIRLVQNATDGAAPETVYQIIPPSLVSALGAHSEEHRKMIFFHHADLMPVFRKMPEAASIPSTAHVFVFKRERHEYHLKEILNPGLETKQTPDEFFAVSKKEAGKIFVPGKFSGSSRLYAPTIKEWSILQEGRGAGLSLPKSARPFENSLQDAEALLGHHIPAEKRTEANTRAGIVFEMPAPKLQDPKQNLDELAFFGKGRVWVNDKDGGRFLSYAEYDNYRSERSRPPADLDIPKYLKERALSTWRYGNGRAREIFLMPHFYSAGSVFKNSREWWKGMTQEYTQTGRRKRLALPEHVPGQLQVRRITLHHEGIDILAAIMIDPFTKEEKIFAIYPGIQIHPLALGKVVAIIPDFLGETIVMQHPQYRNAYGDVLYSLHTHVKSFVPVGTEFKQERDLLKALGEVAEPGAKKPNSIPHWHFSVMWAPEDITAKTGLKWSDFHPDLLPYNPSLGDFYLIDPLSGVGNLQSFFHMTSGNGKRQMPYSYDEGQVELGRSEMRTDSERIREEMKKAVRKFGRDFTVFSLVLLAATLGLRAFGVPGLIDLYGWLGQWAPDGFPWGRIFRSALIGGLSSGITDRMSMLWPVTDANPTFAVHPKRRWFAFVAAGVVLGISFDLFNFFVLDVFFPKEGSTAFTRAFRVGGSTLFGIAQVSAVGLFINGWFARDGIRQMTKDRRLSPEAAAKLLPKFSVKAQAVKIWNALWTRFPNVQIQHYLGQIQSQDALLVVFIIGSFMRLLVGVLANRQGHAFHHRFFYYFNGAGIGLYLVLNLIFSGQIPGVFWFALITMVFTAWKKPFIAAPFKRETLPSSAARSEMRRDKVSSTVSEKEIRAAIQKIHETEGKEIFTKQQIDEITRKVLTWKLMPGKTALVIGPGDQDYLPLFLAHLKLHVTVEEENAASLKSQLKRHRRHGMDQTISVLDSNASQSHYDYVFSFAVLHYSITPNVSIVSAWLQSQGYRDEGMLRERQAILPTFEKWKNYLRPDGGRLYINDVGKKWMYVLEELQNGEQNFKKIPGADVSNFTMSPVYFNDSSRPGAVFERRKNKKTKVIPKINASVRSEMRTLEGQRRKMTFAIQKAEGQIKNYPTETKQELLEAVKIAEKFAGENREIREEIYYLIFVASKLFPSLQVDPETSDFAIRIIDLYKKHKNDSVVAGAAEFLLLLEAAVQNPELRPENAAQDLSTTITKRIQLANGTQGSAVYSKQAAKQALEEAIKLVRSASKETVALGQIVPQLIDTAVRFAALIREPKQAALQDEYLNIAAELFREFRYLPAVQKMVREIILGHLHLTDQAAKRKDWAKAKSYIQKTAEIFLKEFPKIEKNEPQKQAFIGLIFHPLMEAYKLRIQTMLQQKMYSEAEEWIQNALAICERYPDFSPAVKYQRRINLFKTELSILSKQVTGIGSGDRNKRSEIRKKVTASRDQTTIGLKAASSTLSASPVTVQIDFREWMNPDAEDQFSTAQLQELLALLSERSEMRLIVNHADISHPMYAQFKFLIDQLAGRNPGLENRGRFIFDSGDSHPNGGQRREVSPVSPQKVTVTRISPRGEIRFFYTKQFGAAAPKGWIPLRPQDLSGQTLQQAGTLTAAVSRLRDSSIYRKAERLREELPQGLLWNQQDGTLFTHPDIARSAADRLDHRYVLVLAQSA